MKIFNILFSFVLLALLFAGCENNNDPNYSELLTGTWVNTMVNEQTILTDDTYIIEFKSDNTELYAIGIQLDENNESWQENTTYTYNVSGDAIIINGLDVLGNSFHMEFIIHSLDYETLTYTVSKFSINGNELFKENINTCKRVTDDFSTEFTGVWYGRCTTVGNADSTSHYWEYFDDGSYNYYYQDENSNWIKKSDNEGRYFLYGQLMVSNYSHDLLTGGTGMAFECWNFTIDGNKMVWTGLRENNVTITYEMKKVAAPPETL